MTDSPSRVSPRALARLAAVFQLFESVTSSVGQVGFLGRLLVVGDAARTASNILAHPRLYWLGFALSMLGVMFHLAWGLALYRLFVPVRRGAAQFALLVLILCCAMQALAGFLYLAPLLVLNGGGGLSGLAPGQLQSLAYLFLRLNEAAFEIDLIFFGLWCVMTGYLIVRSTFLPRILGALLAIDGLGWMLYLHMPLAHQLFTYIAIASGVAELTLMLWLLIVGLNEARWKEQAAHATPAVA